MKHASEIFLSFAVVDGILAIGHFIKGDNRWGCLTALLCGYTVFMGLINRN